MEATQPVTEAAGALGPGGQILEENTPVDGPVDGPVDSPVGVTTIEDSAAEEPGLSGSTGEGLPAELHPEPPPDPKPSYKYAGDTARMVVFKLVGHEHALDVRRVKEILMAGQISPVIEAPDFVEGVIKLRGRIVPVVDLKKRLQLPAVPRTYEACIIIVRMQKKMVGLLVDSASELLKVPTRAIEPPDKMIGGVRTRFIDGVAYLDDRLLVILNLDEILAIDEKELLELELEKDGDRERKESAPIETGTTLTEEQADDYDG
ncbi:MAG: chemotaxis protein CheW [Deltaproteobacteria bacterium]|nr:chemotaxis protein CheW [Deltaproteobacteria bacterium]